MKVAPFADGLVERSAGWSVALAVSKHPLAAGPDTTSRPPLAGLLMLRGRVSPARSVRVEQVDGYRDAGVALVSLTRARQMTLRW